MRKSRGFRPDDRYKKIGSFEFENIEWEVYKKREDSDFINLKVLSLQSVAGYANLWLSIKPSGEWVDNHASRKANDDFLEIVKGIVNEI